MTQLPNERHGQVVCEERDDHRWEAFRNSGWDLPESLLFPAFSSDVIRGDLDC
ncbi:hypothetical protein P12x_002048 [Tundrisphaera lichenicola]|uniref:hypothetical protein n=1 Tax=Tundrisphaera lichenicola TaxID=2029860 RepID=UPI003EB9459E